MPESKKRKKSTYTPPANASGSEVKPVRIGSPRWLAPTMVAMFVVGLIWIVLWYLAPNSIPIIKDLGWVNLLIGFGFFGVGFILATKWE